MKNILNKIKNNDKYRKIVIFSILGVIIVLLIVLLIHNGSGDKDINVYNEIKTLIDNKESAIIYYYNSNSSNKNNKKIKKYLDKLNISYYSYDDKYVDKKEYRELMKLLKLDNSLFGCPAILYLKNGNMYANSIHIDSESVVKQFLDDYDLYTVK